MVGKSLPKWISLFHPFSISICYTMLDPKPSRAMAPASTHTAMASSVSASFCSGDSNFSQLYLQESMNQWIGGGNLPRTPGCDLTGGP